MHANKFLPTGLFVHILNSFAVKVMKNFTLTSCLFTSTTEDFIVRKMLKSKKIF